MLMPLLSVPLVTRSEATGPLFLSNLASITETHGKTIRICLEFEDFCLKQYHLKQVHFPRLSLLIQVRK